MISKIRKRRGISELVEALLTTVVTLIAGAALFGYVKGQGAKSENGGYSADSKPRIF